MALYKPFPEIKEVDQAGQLVARYVGSRIDDDEAERMDVLVPGNTAFFRKSLLSAFLPAGYPQSVTSDYLPYQIYDSLQAFSSSIAGLLAARAVLEGVGVGNADASPTAAVMLSILQDTMGRVVTIFFAHRSGTSLEPECKKYRLAADVFNDGAMILDCVSPALPKMLRILVLSLASVLRALCGVAAGSSKASLSAHFATKGNLGELNAKDSSQETIIGLLGMGFGSLIIPHIDTMVKTWFSLLFLLFLHLGTNYLAVRAVCMKTLNRQRANIIFTTYVGNHYTGRLMKVETAGIVLDPTSVSRLEHVFETDGVLRWNGQVIGTCIIGASLKEVLKQVPAIATTASTGSMQATGSTFSVLLDVFCDENYVLSYDRTQKRFLIALMEEADTKTQLQAWLHALLIARDWTPTNSMSADIVESYVQHLALSLKRAQTIWHKLMPLLKQQGWDLETGALETKPKTRIRVEGSA